MKRISVALAVCLLVSVAVSEGPVASLREAAAIGDAQEKDPATKKYFGDDLIPYYEKQYSPVYQSCLAATDHPDTSPFEFVAAVGADGRVLRLYIDRETNIFTCVRQRLLKDEFPHPPTSPYYLRIEMRFSQ
jgi:hypothetical protein